MFARDTLLIPSSSLPLDADAAIRVAHMVTSHARGNASVDGSRRKQPGTSAFTRSGSRDALTESFKSQGRNYPGSPPSTSRENSIELQSMMAQAPQYAGDRHGSASRSDDRVNRRRSAVDDIAGASTNNPVFASEPYSGETSAEMRAGYGAMGPPTPSPLMGRPGLFSNTPPPSGRSSGPRSSGSSVGESLFAKIKRAASTPALAAPVGPTLAVIGDALANAAGPSVGVMAGGSSAGSGRLASRTAVASPGKFDCAKED